ncbi:hypothetical protein A5784_14140 [Mycobacterium sp. 852013-50091_SCH5140682]|uniref:glycosyl hydrolase family 28-related protein n=1 Tax=Mycobacterium sp. 852013-50091_SCH5140682 TaxID=1834109 RepID=UPI0007EB6490|nr:glycosyl hydrolase family 28-related protein [Mycobacterium sp. 852013-50091_SCH5140682]OBC03369.1 hypothetical protein A5784_14140 [Mycobacterium sp. 852013-50091_SCH5140682]
MTFTPKTWHDSPDRSTPITAAELNRIEQGVASAYVAPVFVNVKDRAYGAKGDGVADDTTAINNAIANSPVGSTIFFPQGTYLASNRIVLYPDRQYLGAGAAVGARAAIIKQKNGTNLTGGLLVAQAWNTNAATCDNPVLLQGICVDGNSANNATSTAHGIVLTNFWARAINCAVFNVKGDGIRLTDTTANGANIVSNSCSENVVQWCKFDNIGGDAIRNVSGNGNSNMDGFCENNLISTVAGNGILLDKGAGWKVRGNHLYGIGVNAIDISKAFATVVEGNYIEDFGLQATNGVWYSGITLTQLDGRGSQIVNNFIGTTEPSSSVGAYIYLLAKSGSAQTDAQVIVSGNAIHGPSSPTTKGTGLYFDVASGGVLKVHDVANDVRGMNTLRQSYLGVEFQAATRRRATTVNAPGATPSINCNAWDQVNYTGMAAPITGITITGTPVDGQELTIRFKDNGTAQAITHGTGFVGTLLATTVAGKTHVCTYRYDAAAAKWAGTIVNTAGY